MAKVEDMGGAAQAIEHGFQKHEIETSAYRIAQEIDNGERVVVGVNRYRSEMEDPYEPLRQDPAIEQQQVERLDAAARGARRRRGGPVARRAARGGGDEG